MIEHGQRHASSMVASILGVITLVSGASGVFSELRSILNKLWDIKPESQSGLYETVRQ